MVNHPNRKRPFRVWVWTAGTEDLESGFAVVVEGPGADDTIARSQELAEYMERALNAAYAAFAKKP